MTGRPNMVKGQSPNGCLLGVVTMVDGDELRHDVRMDFYHFQSRFDSSIFEPGLIECNKPCLRKVPKTGTRTVMDSKD